MVLVDGKSVWSAVWTEECWITLGAWVVCWIVMKTLENDDTLLDALEAKDVVGITRVDEVGNAKKCILVRWEEVDGFVDRVCGERLVELLM